MLRGIILNGLPPPQPQACNWEKETPLRPTQGTFLSRTIRIENEFLCFCLVSIEPVGGEELKLQNHGCCLYYVDQVTFLYSPNLLTPQLPLSSSVLFVASCSCTLQGIKRQVDITIPPTLPFSSKKKTFTTCDGQYQSTLGAFASP